MSTLGKMLGEAIVEERKRLEKLEKDEFAAAADQYINHLLHSGDLTADAREHIENTVAATADDVPTNADGETIQ